MEQRKVLNQVSRLLDAKERAQENISRIENGDIKGIRGMIGTTKTNKDYRLFDVNDHWVNKERFYSKIKYLILAEMKETLDEINAEIDKRVAFKESAELDKESVDLEL